MQPSMPVDLDAAHCGLLVLGTLVIALFFLHKTRYRRQIAQLDAEKDCDMIYHLLACYEFPWECFYGINIAFYRTFSSVMISGIYHHTAIINSDPRKRVEDTDILMHTWFDHGLQSKKADDAFKRINTIHSQFTGRKNNTDFLYVLCCFIVDTITMIQLCGWRSLSQHEKQAIFHFWHAVGQRMGLMNIPNTLDEVYLLVDEYIISDKSSAPTPKGHDLMQSIHRVVKQWYWFLPGSLVEKGVVALLYIVGGELFVKKLGAQLPSGAMVFIVRMVAFVRAAVVAVLPPRMSAHKVSDSMYSSNYHQPSFDANLVGPDLPSSKPRNTTA